MLNFTTRLLSKVSVALSLAIASGSTALPAQAATFADSVGEFFFSNFSQAPLGSDSTAFTSSFTSGSGSLAISDADALFTTLPEAQASNFVANSAFTADTPGEAFAQSESSIIGDFVVEAGETFSFDFSGFIDLFTAVDQPDESATAFLETQYSIFQSDIGIDNGVVVDSFGLLGLLDTPGEDALVTEATDAITLDTFDVTEVTGPDLLEELLVVDVAGRYERLFEQDSILTLVEFKIGNAGSQAAQVPDSSNPLFGLFVVGAAVSLIKKQRDAESVFS